MKFIDPRIDFAFKKIFGSEETKDILISFLESVLGLTGDHCIAELTIMDPFMAPRIKMMKSSILDVRCRDYRGISYIVEMQVQKTGGFLKRIQFNAAKAYVNQIAKGDDFPKLEQVIAITITDFVLFKELSGFVSYHETREVESGQNFLNGILYYFIELPKFVSSVDNLHTPLEKWVFFIKEASLLSEIPPNFRDQPFLHAFECAEESAMDPEEYELYDKARIAVAITHGAIELAREESRLEGRWEGRQEGRQEGFREAEIRAMIRQIRHQFDTVPEWVHSKLAKADLASLESWNEKIYTASSLESVFE